MITMLLLLMDCDIKGVTLLHCNIEATHYRIAAFLVVLETPEIQKFIYSTSALRYLEQIFQPCYLGVVSKISHIIEENMLCNSM